MQENGRDAVQRGGEYVWFGSLWVFPGGGGGLMCEGTGSLAGCCPVGSVCVDSAEGRCTLSSEGVRGIGNVGFVKVAVAGAMGYFAV